MSRLRWLPRTRGCGSQSLTTRVRELAERYATPLPNLAEDVECLAARVETYGQEARLLTRRLRCSACWATERGGCACVGPTLPSRRRWHSGARGNTGRSRAARPPNGANSPETRPADSHEDAPRPTPNGMACAVSSVGNQAFLAKPPPGGVPLLGEVMHQRWHPPRGGRLAPGARRAQRPPLAPRPQRDASLRAAWKGPWKNSSTRRSPSTSTPRAHATSTSTTCCRRSRGCPGRASSWTAEATSCSTRRGSRERPRF